MIRNQTMALKRIRSAHAPRTRAAVTMANIIWNVANSNVDIAPPDASSVSPPKNRCCRLPIIAPSLPNAREYPTAIQEMLMMDIAASVCAIIDDMLCLLNIPP